MGLQQMNPPANTDWVVFDAGAVKLCLISKDKNSIRNKATNFALYSGTRKEVAALHARLEATNFALYSGTRKEVAALHARLAKDGYKVTRNINPEKDKTMGRLRHEKTMTTFWIKDPAGNTVQIESLRTN